MDLSLLACCVAKQCDACLVGTLTRNEQTVTQVYTVDEIIHIDLSVSPCFSKPLSLPLRKALNIGALCNNAARNESGEFVGDSTEIALLDVLEYFEVPDPRTVSIWPSMSP